MNCNRENENELHPKTNMNEHGTFFAKNVNKRINLA
jgi:hypothetical protein